MSHWATPVVEVDGRIARHPKQSIQRFRRKEIVNVCDLYRFVAAICLLHGVPIHFRIQRLECEGSQNVRETMLHGKALACGVLRFVYAMYIGGSTGRCGNHAIACSKKLEFLTRGICL